MLNFVNLFFGGLTGAYVIFSLVGVTPPLDDEILAFTAFASGASFTSFAWGIKKGREDFADSQPGSSRQ